MVMLFCQAMNRLALAKYVILRIKVHISMDFNYSIFGMYPLLLYALWNQKKIHTCMTDYSIFSDRKSAGRNTGTFVVRLAAHQKKD